MTSLAFLVGSLLLIVIQYFLDGKKLDIFNPKTLFQIYFIIQLPLALMIGTNWDAFGFFRLSLNTKIEEIIILGLLFFCAHLVLIISYYSFGSSCLALPSLTKIQWCKKRVEKICILFFIIGYIAFLGLINLNGGYDEFIKSRESWRAGGMKGQGWIIFLCTSMLVTSTLAYIINRCEQYQGKYGKFKFISIMILSLIPSSQLGFRNLILLPVIQFMFLYHWRIKKLEFRRIILPLIFVTLAFTFYGIYREASSLMSGDFSIVAGLKVMLEKPELLLAIILRSKGADIVSVVMAKVNSFSEYLYFIPSLVEVLTIPIPSILWEGKPLPLGIQFSDKFFGISGGVSPTVIGEGYWNGGVAGVFLYMGLIGVFFRLFYNSLKRYYKSDSLFFIFASIFSSLVMLAESVQGYTNGIFLNLLFSTFLIILFSIRINLK
jgi:oligosaccharide repeat unit polymerase